MFHTQPFILPLDLLLGLAAADVASTRKLAWSNNGLAPTNK